MNKFKIVSAAAILSLMCATPVFAQAPIQDPGAFAFYYPNNDVLNGGRPTPAAGPDAMTPELFGAAARSSRARTCTFAGTPRSKSMSGHPCRPDIGRCKSRKGRIGTTRPFLFP